MLTSGSISRTLPPAVRAAWCRRCHNQADCFFSPLFPFQPFYPTTCSEHPVSVLLLHARDTSSLVTDYGPGKTIRHRKRIKRVYAQRKSKPVCDAFINRFVTFSSVYYFFCLVYAFLFFGTNCKMQCVMCLMMACSIFPCALLSVHIPLFFFVRREQSRKDAFDQRKRELKALGLGQDGRPIKKADDGKEKKGRGKVGIDFSSKHAVITLQPFFFLCCGICHDGNLACGMLDTFYCAWCGLVWFDF